MSSYAELMLRLAAGAQNLPEGTRRRHAAYLAQAQREDGGFAGRRGASDLYYTGFALRGLAVLGELTEEIASRTGMFLSPLLAYPLPMPPADSFSLVTSTLLVELATGRDLFAEAGCDRCQFVLDCFERYRRTDGGYAKTEQGTSSTYQTFLVVLAKQFVAAPLDGSEQIVQLVRSRRREDGGFVELDALRASGTNPTAAAIGLLQALDALDEPTAAAARQFLTGMQTPDGGLRAHARIPFADLLSTCTGLVTLAGIDRLAEIDAASARRFVESLEVHAGGFRAGHWDATVDTEYTFYGLGTLAALAGSGDSSG